MRWRSLGFLRWGNRGRASAGRRVEGGEEAATGEEAHQWQRGRVETCLVTTHTLQPAPNPPQPARFKTPLIPASAIPISVLTPNNPFPPAPTSRDRNHHCTLLPQASKVQALPLVRPRCRILLAMGVACASPQSAMVG